MLTLYRIAMTLGLPLLAGNTILNPRQRRPGALIQRLGLGAGEPKAPVIWIHAASNGEVTAARPVMERILSDLPNSKILLTVHTATGYDLALGWNLNRVTVGLAPYDVPFAIRAFLNRWRPVAHITVENEAWPNRILTCAARDIPCWFIGARLSERSHARWKSKAPGLARQVFQSLDYVWPQDQPSAERFRDLGVPQDRIGPVETLKSSVISAPLPADFSSLSKIFDRDETILAASTHPGEDTQVLDAFSQARAELPNLRLILAPRHPRRAADVIAEINAAGLTFAQRSRGDMPDAQTSVYLADRLGEMTAWYRLSALAFVGGSLVDLGGHTPYEPALEDCAIAHGPFVSNQADAYRTLQTADASIPVRDVETLRAAFLKMNSPAQLAKQAARARRALLDGPEGIVAGELTSRLSEILRRFA